MKLGLALCYELGFGTDRDPVRSQLMIDELNTGPWVFQAMIEFIKKEKAVTHFSTFYDNHFACFDHEAFIPVFNPSQQHREEKRLAAAESQYSREVRTFGYVLGHRHALVQKLRQQLTLLFEDRGKWKDAEKMQLEMISCAGKEIPWQYLTNLARIFWHQNRNKEAENLVRMCVGHSVSFWGQEHSITQANTQLLALVIPDDAEASAILHQSAQIIKRTMGENHPDTIASLEYHALRLLRHHRKGPRLLDNIEEIEQKLRHTLAMWTSVMGENHSKTVGNMYQVARVLIEHGNLLKKETIMRQLSLRLSELHLGEEHSDRLISLLMRADIQTWVAPNENMNMFLGPISSDLQSSLEDLNLLKRILHDAGDALLRDALLMQEKYREGEQYYRKAVKLKEEMSHEKLRGTTEGLGWKLFDGYRARESEELFRDITAKVRPPLKKDYYRTGLNVCSMANDLLRQGKHGEAEELTRGRWDVI